jgi:hypothetical protein
MNTSEEIRDIALRIEMKLADAKRPGRNPDMVHWLEGAASLLKSVCLYCHEAANRLVEHARLYYGLRGVEMSADEAERLRLDMLRELHRIRLKAGHWQMLGN